MNDSIVERIVITLLFVLITITIFGWSNIFRKGDAQIVKPIEEPKPAQKLLQKSEANTELFDSPIWLPWSSGWVGGYLGEINRPMPYYNPLPPASYTI